MFDPKRSWWNQYRECCTGISTRPAWVEIICIYKCNICSTKSETLAILKMILNQENDVNMHNHIWKLKKCYNAFTKVSICWQKFLSKGVNKRVRLTLIYRVLLTLLAVFVGEHEAKVLQYSHSSPSLGQDLTLQCHVTDPGYPEHVMYYVWLMNATRQILYSRRYHGLTTDKLTIIVSR